MSTSILDPGTQFTIKANTVFNEAGQTINLSIVYRKLLAVLLSRRVGRINATIENLDNLKAGVAIYYIARRNISRDYTAGTSAPDVVAQRQVNIPLDYRKEVSYVYETLDLEQLGAKLGADGSATVSGAMINSWLNAKAKSVEAYLYAKKLQIATSTTETLIHIGIPSTLSTDDFRRAWLEISTAVYAKMSEINEEYIGLDFEDGNLWAAPEIYPALINAVSTLGSDISANKLIDGMESLQKIGGINVIPAPFLGQQYATGSIDKDEAFDFRGITPATPINLMWVHKEAIAFPFNRGLEQTFILPSNGNIHNFHKFMVNKDGGTFLRPKAVIPFAITFLPVPPVPPLTALKSK